MPEEERLGGFIWLEQFRWQKMLRWQKVQRSIFSTGIFWQLHFTTKDTLSATGRSLQHTEAQSVLLNREAGRAFTTTSLQDTHMHTHTLARSQVSAADPTAYSQQEPAQHWEPPTAVFRPDLRGLRLQLHGGTMQPLVGHQREWTSDWLNVSSLSDVRPRWARDKLTHWIRHIKKTQISSAAWKSAHLIAQQPMEGTLHRSLRSLKWLHNVRFPNHWDVYRTNTA